MAKIDESRERLKFWVDSVNGERRQIPVDNVNFVGLEYAEISGPLSTSPAISADLGLSGSHTVLRDLAGGTASLELEYINPDGTKYEMPGGNNYLCTSYTIDPVVGYKAEFRAVGGTFEFTSNTIQEFEESIDAYSDIFAGRCDYCQTNYFPHEKNCTNCGAVV